MSRNFELLQRIEKQGAVCAEPTPVRHNGDGELAFALKEDVRQPALDMDETTREEFIKLAQQLFLFPALAKRVVVFSAVERGNGCSWVTARTAQVLAAQVSAEVCIVDANFRAPILHNYFAVHNHHGYMDAVLQGGSITPLIHRLPGQHLSLMTTGTSAAGEPLNSDRLHSLMDELRAGFEYVLIDAPPLSLYTDAIALAHLADGIALVVQEN
jgi:Mrp family chromosome partitioning ATPase